MAKLFFSFPKKRKGCRGGREVKCAPLETVYPKGCGGSNPFPGVPSAHGSRACVVLLTAGHKDFSFRQRFLFDLTKRKGCSGFLPRRPSIYAPPLRGPNGRKGAYVDPSRWAMNMPSFFFPRVFLSRRERKRLLWSPSPTCITQFFALPL